MSLLGCVCQHHARVQVCVCKLRGARISTEKPAARSATVMVKCASAFECVCVLEEMRLFEMRAQTFYMRFAAIMQLAFTHQRSIRVCA